MIYHNLYVPFYLFFFIPLFLEIESFTPSGRLAHSSVLVDNKLYFIGGVVNDNFCSNEVFFLDVSQPFNIQTPPWNDLTPNSGLPFKSCWGTASSNKINNEQTIFLFGGITMDASNNDYFVSIIYSFNLKSLTWNVPTVKGIPPERRRETKSVIDNTGKMYMFSGVADSNVGSPTIKHFNNMVIFNTIDSSWLTNVSPIIARASYSATLLPNGVIVYIGGYDSTPKNVDISQISLYDTKSSTWTSKVAKLIDPIEGRDTHAAVLAPNGKIIVHGGSKISADYLYAQVTPAIAVLNTETEPFEWTAPLVSSNIGEVPSLSAHTANIVDNYMIVAFGNITQPNGEPLDNKNSKIYLMDIRNFTWVYSFEPSTPPNNSNNSTSDPLPTYTQPSASNELTMKIVTATLSAIFVTIFIMAIGFFGYRWYKKRQRESESEPDGVLRIYGNQSNTY